MDTRCAQARTLGSTKHGLSQAVLVLVAAASLVGLTQVGPAIAWEFGDGAEVFDSANHLQDIAYSEDGSGGMLAITVNQDPTPDRVMVTRLDHTGNEVWGNNGVYLPIGFSDQWHSWPVAVTHDGGTGGGYFGYRAGLAGSEELRLTHVTASGSVDWTIPVDNLGASGISPEVTLTPTLNGEVIMIWTRLVPSVQLYAARVDASGTVLWHGQAITSAWTSSIPWTAKPDAQGGVLVGYTTQPGDARVQRLAAANGARMWGNDGTLVWSLLGAAEDVVADGSGGAYVVRSLAGVAWAQHLNASGTTTWISDVRVHDSQTPWFGLSTGPRLCSDGAGGFVMVHGLENVFAQRVDSFGTSLWGAGVQIATGTDVGPSAEICADGSGGALITYHDSWTISGSDVCRQVNAARVDGFGTIIWDDLTEFCSFSWGPGTSITMHYQPRNGVPISDGSGGAMVGWEEYHPDQNASLRVLAQGYDVNGQAPTPRLTFLAPDSGEPGQTGPYSILGDYIDLNMSYKLVKEDGSAQLSLTPNSQPISFLVQGTMTLTGLTQGAYHLVVTDGAAATDTLHHALGVGGPLPCTMDEPVVQDPRSVDLSGSRRQSVFDSQGRIHTVWTEYDAGAGMYLLRWQMNDGGWVIPASLAADTMPLRGATIACDSQDRLHIAAIKEVTSTRHDIVYLRLNAFGGIEVNDLLSDGLEHRGAVLSVTQDDVAHLVCETGSGGTQELTYFPCDGAIGAPQTITSGFLPREPDLAAVNGGLELVFLRDSAFPGVQQVERAAFSGGAWASPEMLTFALSVQSPSVTFDGTDQILYAWILDNEAFNAIPPLVHTQLRTAGVLGEMRARPGLLRHHAVQVAAAGPGQFVMMTTESDGGPVMSIFLREGDGNVFFPRTQVNSGTDVALARLTAQYGGTEVFAHWRDYQDPNLPVFGVRCQRATVTAIDGPAPRLDIAKFEALPNPFNPSTRLEFELGWDADVRLTIYDARGRRIRRLFEGPLSAGPHTVAWRGRDDHGSRVASGVYFAHLDRGNGQMSVTKMALVE